MPSNFRSVPATRTRLNYWPLEKREQNRASRPGMLHMKCAIVEDVALIGSTNLTDAAEEVSATTRTRLPLQRMRSAVYSRT